MTIWRDNEGHSMADIDASLAATARDPQQLHFYPLMWTVCGFTRGNRDGSERHGTRILASNGCCVDAWDDVIDNPPAGFDDELRRIVERANEMAFERMAAE